VFACPATVDLSLELVGEYIVLSQCETQSDRAKQAFVFPNVGFTIATINIGNMFKSEGVRWVGSIMTILIVITYLIVGACHMRAVVTKQILWEGKDEDVYVAERKHKHEPLTERRRSWLGAQDSDIERDEKTE